VNRIRIRISRKLYFFPENIRPRLRFAYNGIRIWNTRSKPISLREAREPVQAVTG